MLKPLGFFRDGQGNKSMGRLVFFLAALLGIAISVGGVIVVFLAILKTGTGMTEGLGLTVAGAGLMAGSEHFKNKGRKLENGG